MKKRIISFLMALVMAVSLLPVSAFAAEDVTSSDAPVTQAAESCFTIKYTVNGIEETATQTEVGKYYVDLFGDGMFVTQGPVFLTSLPFGSLVSEVTTNS